MLTYEEAHYLFDYNEETGELFWKHPTAKRIKAGDKAGSPLHNRYMQVFVHNHSYRVHRIVWLMIYGSFPKGFIDHIDHNGFNNKLYNLREVTVEENNKNISLPKNNTSGVIGVSFNKRRGKWFAQIRSNKKKYYLGLFDSFLDAVKARKEAEIKYGFHRNHGDNR